MSPTKEKEEEAYEGQPLEEFDLGGKRNERKRKAQGGKLKARIGY
jgi:hypothetical protein